MLTRRGQSILEYTMIVGILTVLLYYMGTSIKRGVQSLVKVAADQVGNQQDSDQDFNDTQTGYLVASNDEAEGNKAKQVIETGDINESGIPVYSMNTSFNESSYTMSNSISNGGFSPSG